MPIMRTAALETITPRDLDFPAKFKEFRPVQREIARFALESASPLAAISAPAGCGKTLATQLLGMLSGVKFGVLTATKALQDQVVDDEFLHLVDIRGRANYTCCHPNFPTMDCEEADEEGCRFAATPACTYTAQYYLASEAQAFVTNYAYWMAVRRLNRAAFESELHGPVELLICDEAHMAADELSRALAFWIGRNDLLQYAPECIGRRHHGGPLHGFVDQEWREILTEASRSIFARMQEIQDQYGGIANLALRVDRRYRKLAKLSDGLSRVLRHSEDGNWVWRHDGPGTRFECIWPARYAAQYLFSGVPKVLFLAANLRHKALQMLGLMPSAYAYTELPEQFPAANGPVWWVKTGRMKYGNSEDIDASAARADQMIDRWQDFKGIIHTSSYDNAKAMKSRSRWKHKMFINEPGTAVKTAEDYRRAAPPAVLISPSYGTGWDFPDEQCNWQIINKLPFAGINDPVVDARRKADRAWYDYDCAQRLYQKCKRGNRHYDDKCCTIITDDLIQRFRVYARQHFPIDFNVWTWTGGGVPGPESLGL